MATLQQNYQNTSVLTLVPDEVLILSKAEAVGKRPKPQALQGGSWGHEVRLAQQARQPGTQVVVVADPSLPFHHIHISHCTHPDAHTHMCTRTCTVGTNTPIKQQHLE